MANKSSYMIFGLYGPLLVTEGFGLGIIVTALSINPGRVKPSVTVTLQFIGQNTTWNSTAPTFSATGAPTLDLAWLIGTKTIIDDTHATLVLTTGAVQGTVVWTDSTTSDTTTMTVEKHRPAFMFKRYR